jgi:predicted TIM-barrel fold metal-dependent hydrolase
MDLDGVDASVMFPNLSLFVLFTDDHELSMAHARVYNDYVVERYLPYKDRMRPTAAIPLTDIDDAVAEIERIAPRRPRGHPLPEIPPCRTGRPSTTGVGGREANGTPVFIHVATGGVKVKPKGSPARPARSRG